MVPNLMNHFAFDTFVRQSKGFLCKYRLCSKSIFWGLLSDTTYTETFLQQTVRESEGWALSYNRRKSKLILLVKISYSKYSFLWVLVSSTPAIAYLSFSVPWWIDLIQHSIGPGRTQQFSKSQSISR
jgi:hypothetical protein